tara:strand:+ start:1156 stop:3696 length:2541 start_codon:yes stop_codon:yes gene_type:complete
MAEEEKEDKKPKQEEFKGGPDRETLANLDQYYSKVVDLNDQLRYVNSLVQERTTIEKQSMSLSNQLVNVVQKMKGQYDNVKDVQKDLSKIQGKRGELEKIQTKLSEQLTGKEKQRVQLAANIEKGISRQKNELKTMLDAEGRGLKIDEERKKQLQDNISNQEKGLATRIKNMSVEERQLYVTDKALGATKDIEKALEKELQIQKKIEESLGLTGKGFSAINSLLGGALGDTEEILQTTKDKLRVLEEEGKLRDDLAGKMQGFKILTAEIGKSIMKNLVDPLTYIKAGLEFDKQATQLQKGLALSAAESYTLRSEMSMAAAQSGDMAISSAKVQKAFMTMNAQLGIASEALAGMAVDAAIMQEKMGLSDKAIGGATKSALILGKSMKAVKLDVISSTTSIRQQTGIALDYKQILEKTLQTNGQIAAQLGANPEKIAAAVAQAKALGMELEQVAAVGNSLLEFEQSISAELEAELLTGKQLNLERARMLALTGDYEALSKEIAEQAGSFSEFSQMNVLQQNALAKSFGMSADEMSNMLMDQEAMGKTAKQLRAEGKEDIAQRLEARDAQQKFTDAVEKMKGIFVDLVGGPLGTFLNILVMAMEPIAFILESVSAVFGLFTGSTEELGVMQGIVAAIALTYGTMFAIVKGKLVYDKLSAIWAGRKAISENASKISLVAQRAVQIAAIPIQAALAAITGVKAAAEISAASALSMGLGIAIIIGGIIAGVAAMMSAGSSAKAVANDAIFEGGGYGKRTLLEEGKVTLFNDRDTIVAGTNLNKTNDTINAPEGGITVQNQNQQPLIDYDQLAGAMANVQVQGGNVQFDSEAYRDPNALDGQSQNTMQAQTKF